MEKRKEILSFHGLILKRKDSLLKVESLTEVSSLPDLALLNKLKKHSENLEERAKDYDEYVLKEKRDELKKRATELEAKKYLSGLKDKIEEEVARLKRIHALKGARRLANSKPISDKKSDIAGELISPAFISRFRDELTTLGASRIKVRLIKTRT